MSKKPTFYRDDDRYITLTGESPKGFKDYLFVAFIGTDAGVVEEGVVCLDDINKMEAIEGADVPNDWADMFRQKGVVIEDRKPEPAPKPTRQPHQKKDVVELTFDLTPSNETQDIIRKSLSFGSFVFVIYTIWFVTQW